MERIEKTKEGSYTVGITHWELLTLHGVLIDWLSSHDGTVHAAETLLERDLLAVIDPDQKEGYE